MILSFDPCAASGENASVQRAIPAKATRPVRNRFLLLIVRHPSVGRCFWFRLSGPSRTLSTSATQDRSAIQIAGRRRDGDRRRLLARADDARWGFPCFRG